MNDKIKNFVMGGGAAVVLVVFWQFVEWRVAVAVSEALAAQDIGTDSKIISMDSKIQANGAGVADNREDIEDNERRVEQAFAVLLGRNPDEIP